MKRTLVTVLVLAVVCLVAQTAAMAQDTEKSFDNGCHVKDWPSDADSAGVYEPNPTYCEGYDKSLDGGDGPDRGLVVGTDDGDE